MNLLDTIKAKWNGEIASPPPPRRPFPEPGDVVKMALPTEDNPNRPGAMFRFGIVVDAKTAPAGGLMLRIVPAQAVQPGQAAKAKPEEFSILDGATAAAAGLRGPATFDLSKTVLVAWDKKFTGPNQEALVGSLPDKQYELFLSAHTAWRRQQQVGINKGHVERENASALKPVNYTPEVNKVVRNRGQVQEVWAR